MRFACALVAALGVVSGATAQAEASSFHQQTAGPNASAQHCVINLSFHRPMQCFPSFRAAIKSATLGRVTDAPNDVKAAMASRRLAAELNQSPPNRILGPGPLVLSILYENINWQGASLTLTGSHACSASPYDVDYSVPSLSASYDYGWNDVISSFVSYANCDTELLENNWFTGAQVGPWVAIPNVGAAMNDRASSILLT